MKDEEYKDRNHKQEIIFNNKNNSKKDSQNRSKNAQKVQVIIDSKTNLHMSNERKMNSSKTNLNINKNTNLLAKDKRNYNSNLNLNENLRKNKLMENLNCNSTKSLIEQCVIERNVNWLKIREQRLKVLQKKMSEKEMKNCSFRPTMYTKNKIYNI